ncbi:MAG: alpha/beta fold hydrolase [Vicinamibacterales bacterium]
MSRRSVYATATLALLLFASVHAQRPTSATPASARGASAGEPAARGAAAFPLTVDSIMRGPDLVGSAPSAVRWSGDSRSIYFAWQKPGEDEASTYVVAREGGEPRKLSEEEARLAPPTSGRWDKARRRLLASDRGDIVIYDRATGVRRQITKTAGNEGSARWARNDTAITFVQGSDLFIVSVDGGDSLLTQLTNIGPRRADPALTESQRVLRDEEQKLLDIVRQRAERRKQTEAEREKEALPRLEINARQTVSDIQLSPDGRYVWVTVTERPAQAGRTADVPNYVTESTYAEMIPTRTNVGDAQSRTQLAIIDLQQKKAVWAEALEPKRGISWSMSELSDDGRFAVTGVRSADNKDRWLVTVDPATGKSRVIDHLHDEAWVRGGGVIGRSGAGGFGAGIAFLNDNRRAAFLSERDGWMHLYTIDVSQEGAQPVRLTSGQWEIAEARLSGDGTKFYLTTTEVHPGERHVYVMGADGGARTRLTTATGAHDLTLSPDETAAADVYSYSTKPPELYVMPKLAPGAEITQVTTTPTEEWRSFKWIDPKLVTYKTRDGKDVYARLYTPEMIGAKRDPLKPAVVFVHGAGYLQNAHKYWSTYYREYMFHNLLASRGYVVLDPDYRASAGYGRDWRTAIYRFMGGKDLEDVVDGAKYLVEAEKVDARRIGVYGGSYGGFITLMAMFTTPDVFRAGAALRPVTDWAHYNHGYTSNILNVPQADLEAYRKSSPIYHAAGLKGALLIAHGMVDTNVHFQDSVRLVQRLIELRKENWELAAYPVENHGFVEETSWADEYKRILKLFEENLRRK